jgi:DNA-binding XRE family transcriptional regulator
MPKQNISPSDYPQAVLQEIERLAQHIVVARKRRGETQAQWARKLGVSAPTMARIERGDPSVAMASYVMCLWLINTSVSLAELIAPANDHAALEREVSRLRRKARPQRPASPRKVAADPPNEAKPREIGPNNPTAEGLASLLLKSKKKDS